MVEGCQRGVRRGEGEQVMHDAALVGFLGRDGAEGCILTTIDDGIQRFDIYS